MADQVIVTSRIKRAMIAVVDSVETYPYHVCADVPVKKLDAVVQKFIARYHDLSRDRKHAWRLRKSGQPSHKLIVFRPDTERDIQGFFVLLSSQPDASGEKWLDARERKSRIVVYDYELVRHTRAGQNKPSWTWRITADHYKHLHEQMRDAIDKRKDDWLLKWLRSTTHWPGFAGVRAQHYALKKSFYGRWNRTRKGAPPEFPRLPYVTRRVACDGSRRQAQAAGPGPAAPAGPAFTPSDSEAHASYDR